MSILDYPFSAAMFLAVTPPLPLTPRCTTPAPSMTLARDGAELFGLVPPHLLLSEILRRLSVVDLCRVSRTCRLLRDACAEPSLWRSLTLSTRAPAAARLASCGRRVERLVLAPAYGDELPADWSGEADSVLEAILAPPSSLAASVRELVVDSTIALCPASVAALARHAALQAVEFTPQAGSESELRAFARARAHSLRRLAVGERRGLDVFVAWKHVLLGLADAAREDGPLEALEALQIDARRTDGTRELDALLTACDGRPQMPALRQFASLALPAGEEMKYLMVLSVAAPNVEVLGVDPIPSLSALHLFRRLKSVPSLKCSALAHRLPAPLRYLSHARILCSCFRMTTCGNALARLSESLPSLRELALYNFAPDNAARAIEHARGLKKLALAYTGEISAELFAALSRSDVRLVSLSIGGGVSDFAKLIARLPVLSQLHELVFEDRQVTECELRAIADSACARTLRALAFSVELDAAVPHAELAGLLERCPGLEVLRLTGAITGYDIIKCTQYSVFTSDDVGSRAKLEFLLSTPTDEAPPDWMPAKADVSGLRRSRCVIRSLCININDVVPPETVREYRFFLRAADYVCAIRRLCLHFGNQETLVNVVCLKLCASLPKSTSTFRILARGVKLSHPTIMAAERDMRRLRPDVEFLVIVVDESGMPVYYDHKDGQMIAPLFLSFQMFVRQNTRQFARVVRAGRTVFVCQSHGPLQFLAVSDQGEPAAELDADLQLVRDLMAMVWGPGALSTTERRRGNLVTQRRNQNALMRLVDTALALCASHQSALVRAIEHLDVNDDIRATCAARLREVLAGMPELRGAALFVGTRVLAQHHASSQASAHVAPHELMLLMMHVQTLFRPSVRASFDHESHRDGAAAAADAEREAAAAAARAATPAAEAALDEDLSDDLSGGTVYVSAPQSPMLSAGDPPGSPEDCALKQPPGTPSMHIRNSSNTVQLSAQSFGRRCVTPTRAGGKLKIDDDFEAGFDAIERRRAGTGAATPLRSSACSEASRSGAASPAEPDGDYQTSTLYLGGVAHTVFSAELLPRIYIVVVAKGSGSSSKAKPGVQRRVMSGAVCALRDWLAQDYAPFLFTKERAHMPMLSYVAQVPGVVHFIFVDRSRHVTVAPTIAPLYGQELESATHGVEWLTALVWRLVQVSRSHLARGCTSAIIRSRGFQMSYRLWLEGEADETPAVERVLGGRPQPWVITPQFYAELVQHYRTSRLCELFSVYVGSIPATAVARKDRQLLQAIASLHSSVASF
eukprot:m51a1_g3191 putative hermansky-pudlak syndrome 1 protein homolog (1261) ;mRNA; f:440154-444928